MLTQHCVESERSIGTNERSTSDRGAPFWAKYGPDSSPTGFYGGTRVELCRSLLCVLFTGKTFIQTFLFCCIQCINTEECFAPKKWIRSKREKANRALKPSNWLKINWKKSIEEFFGCWPSSTRFVIRRSQWKWITCEFGLICPFGTELIFRFRAFNMFQTKFLSS